MKMVVVRSVLKKKDHMILKIMMIMQVIQIVVKNAICQMGPRNVMRYALMDLQRCYTLRIQ
jgi:hypothetical protein